MPLYEYQCDACGRRFELIQRFADPPAHICAVCGAGPVRKLLSSPAIQFKGSGWYITDYAKKDQRTEAKSGDTTGDAAGTDKSGTDKAAADKNAKDKTTPSDKSAMGGTPTSQSAAASSSSTNRKEPSKSG
jgi:putative FmdB family regulatory protein